MKDVWVSHIVPYIQYFSLHLVLKIGFVVCSDVSVGHFQSYKYGLISLQERGKSNSDSGRCLPLVDYVLPRSTAGLREDDVAVTRIVAMASFCILSIFNCVSWSSLTEKRPPGLLSTKHYPKDTVVGQTDTSELNQLHL